jgi:acetyl esterase/lipase
MDQSEPRRSLASEIGNPLINMTRQVVEEDATPSGWRTTTPGAVIWILLGIIRILIGTFCSAIFYIPSSLRPSKQWTHNQALRTWFMRTVFGIITDIGWMQSVSLKPGKLGRRWVVIEPASPEAYQGPLSHDVVKPQKIGATWYPEPPLGQHRGSAFEGEVDGNEPQGLVALYFHGGSFMWGSGRPDDCGFAADLLNSRLGPGARSLWVQYRLSGDKNDPTPWPGPFQDAMTSYLYLTDELHIPPHRIVVGGDSSGGTLAIGLVRYLVELGQPTPKACLLFSPSVDTTFEADSRDVDRHRNQKTDYIEGRMAAWGYQVFAPSPMRLDGPYLSPSLHPFPTRTAIFVQSGGAEVILDTNIEFVERFQKVSGNKVVHWVLQDAPHDVFLLGPLIGWTKGAEEIANAAVAFLAQL